MTPLPTLNQWMNGWMNEIPQVSNKLLKRLFSVLLSLHRNCCGLNNYSHVCIYIQVLIMIYP